ncbi:MAG: hypothetical protein OEY34_00590 [Cyclobacteriaceae bacterium]|nr:hypothetical protein [Cyclobacteriaceae bacterium]
MKNTETIIHTEIRSLIGEGLNYWFYDHEFVRSPFPEYIREELSKKVDQKYMQWISEQKKEDLKDLTDEQLVEKFEEILFGIGIDLVKTEDEKLSILYPFMPRIGDAMEDHNKSHDVLQKYTVIERKLVQNEKESSLEITSKNAQEEILISNFELPV